MIWKNSREKCLHKRRTGNAQSLLKDKDNKYRSPSNCSQFQVPRVDDLIWDHLERQTWVSDASWQGTQDHLLRGTTVVARAMEALLEAEGDNSEVVRTL